MDKDSIIELQKVDCNCSDCKHMARNLDKLNVSLELHRAWQLNEFTREKERLNKIVNDFYRQMEFEKGFAVEIELRKMKFQFNRNEVLINYGHCDKLNKSVSFIPNTCQLDTQECFTHRRILTLN